MEVVRASIVIDPVNSYGTKALSDLCARDRKTVALRASALVLGIAWLSGTATAQTLQFNGITLADVGLTERVVADKLSGVAIGGYDPVAYFVAGRAVSGSPDFQLAWNGAAWRFAN